MKTYDVLFSDNDYSNRKGFYSTIEQCRNYIDVNNGKGASYFDSYKGGTVSIVCNENGEEVYKTKVK